MRVQEKASLFSPEPLFMYYFRFDCSAVCERHSSYIYPSMLLDPISARSAALKAAFSSVHPSSDCSDVTGGERSEIGCVDTCTRVGATFTKHVPYFHDSSMTGTRTLLSFRWQCNIAHMATRTKQETQRKLRGNLSHE